MAKKVKIKPWVEMKNLYGLDKSGAINTRFRFRKHMENAMPIDRVIEVSKDTQVWAIGTINVYGWHGYYISDDMIEEYID